MKKATYSKNELLVDLKENVLEVHFDKVNGEERCIRCTLDPRILPSNYNPEHLDEMHSRKENKGVVAVWSINDNGWRSFRVESVKFVQVIYNV